MRTTYELMYVHLLGTDRWDEYVVVGGSLEKNTSSRLECCVRFFPCCYWCWLKRHDDNNAADWSNIMIIIMCHHHHSNNTSFVHSFLCTHNIEDSYKAYLGSLRGIIEKMSLKKKQRCLYERRKKLVSCFEKTQNSSCNACLLTSWRKKSVSEKMFSRKFHFSKNYASSINTFSTRQSCSEASCAVSIRGT